MSTKMFTAVCILQLVQARKIQLSDPFGKYLSDYANQDMASKVTIQQLLTHTDGKAISSVRNSMSTGSN